MINNYSIISTVAQTKAGFFEIDFLSDKKAANTIAGNSATNVIINYIMP